MLLDSECRLVSDPDPELRELYALVDHAGGPGDYLRALRLEGLTK
jgi:hypothetical protein